MNAVSVSNASLKEGVETFPKFRRDDRHFGGWGMNIAELAMRSTVMVGTNTTGDSENDAALCSEFVFVFMSEMAVTGLTVRPVCSRG